MEIEIKPEPSAEERAAIAAALSERLETEQQGPWREDEEGAEP